MKSKFLIAFCSLAATGCAVESTAPTEVPKAAAVTPDAPAVAPLPPDATVAEIPGAAAPEPSAAAGRPAASLAESVALPPSAPAAAPTAPALSDPQLAYPASQPVRATPASPTVDAGVVAAPNAPPAPVASQRPAATLDFTSLGARLRTTKAIGVLTKLAVKNQADDLLAQFREYHSQDGAATLPDLRLSYDTLVLKLLSLVRDGDPPLALDIDRSRAAIWDILSDQRKFIDANLMAGASL